MFQTTRLPAVLLLTAVLVGCKQKRDNSSSRPLPPATTSAAAKPIPKTPAGVKITWEPAQTGLPPKIRVDGIEGAKGELACYEAGCHLSIDKLPEGTKVTVGKQEKVVAGSSSYFDTIDLGDQLGAASPHAVLNLEADLMAPVQLFDTGMKVQIVFPDGVKIESPLPKIDFRFSLSNYLEQSAKDGKPVLFGKEGDAPAKPKGILYAGIMDSAIIGQVKTMRDIDLVSVNENLPDRSGDKKCSGYQVVGQNGPAKELDLWLVDWQVKLVDRRTGKVVDQKKFEAPKVCPSSALGDKATNFPDSPPVKTWLHTKL